MRFLVLFTSMIAACAADEPALGDSAPATPDDTATTSPPTDTGWECNPWYPCQNCGGNACAGQISACAANPTCGAALNQWAACVLDCGDPAACAETFGKAGGPSGSLLTCVQSSCAEVCDL